MIDDSATHERLHAVFAQAESWAASQPIPRFEPTLATPPVGRNRWLAVAATLIVGIGVAAAGLVGLRGGGTTTAESPTRAAEPVDPEVIPPRAWQIVTAIPDSTVASIAIAYGVTISGLVTANGWSDANHLVTAGDEVVVPPRITAGAVVTYAVQVGDYLAGIAGRFGVTVDEVLRINNWSDEQSVMLVLGQSVLVPPPGWSGTVITHTIRYGDHLFGIADAYGTDVDALIVANAWPDGIGHPLFLGDHVVVPVA